MQTQMPSVTSSSLAADVRPRHAFDYARFEQWCADQIPGFGRMTEIFQISGGASNPTFIVTTNDGPATRKFVLRKQPPGKLLPSAHQVDREYRIMKALVETDVPVPNVRALCMDTSVIGVTFYVMDFVEGRVFEDAQLAGFTPAQRAAVYDDLNATLAKLHKVDFAAIGLGDFGRPGNYFERQIGRWIKQYRGAQTEDIPAMERLIDYLPAHIPNDDAVTIAHGDYRLQNTMVHPTEPRLVAVLDWELATLGNPLADVAYNGLLWEFESGTWGWLKGADLKALGIPTQHEFVASYLRRVGRERVEDWNFYLGFALFRLASIGQGVYKRVLDGNASSVTNTHNRTQGMAEQAWAIIERGPCEIRA
jgi:aminoglycoside phosphotransferase (APT) family kinase protein